MNLELTNEDARFLLDQLKNHVRAVETELIHTDSRPLQAELARDLARLRDLEQRLAALLTSAAERFAG